jgi:hypothetical protein
MNIILILHVTGEEAVVGEAEDIPLPTDLSVRITNPRRIDGKELHYLSENVSTIIYPMSRINFIEVLPSRDDEELIGFVRE